MNRENWISEVLAGLREKGLERKLQVYPESGGRVRLGDRTYLNFSSNDYLDLTHHPRVLAAAEDAVRRFGAGSGASRLVTGTLPIHEELEQRLAGFKGYPAALVFGSGYLANTGTISSLVGRGDAVFADKLCHASILDAITLSRAKLIRFQHNDPQHLEELLRKRQAAGRRLVVTESVFSMDGDLAPLPELCALAEKHDAMIMVDEAHATGVFGPRGSGLLREHHLESAVNVSMGTLSKAMGGYGGFVACSTALRDLLVNRARGLIYTTALPPAAAGAALGALDVLGQETDLGERLLLRAAFFRKHLAAAGLDTMQSASQIIPLLVGNNAKTLALSQRLREQGLLAAAIRPPTVPAGTARLRLSVTLAHTEGDLKAAADTIAASARAEGLM
ncbi:MAG: 8-amino-7-oxononanoate synthase [Verrucomicrobiota bacterium]